MALARWQRTIVDAAGNALPGAQVTVRDESTGSLAVLYSDRDGATLLGNPFTADGDGLAAFHVTGGAYRIDAVSGSISATWRYVGVGTMGEIDSAVKASGSTEPRELADRFADLFNVLDYGAAGDGVTDDTAAIQATVDACGAAGGGVVYLPAGSYLVSDAIVLASGIWLRGDGSASLLTCASLVSGGSLIGRRIIDATSISSFRISDLKFDTSDLSNGNRCFWSYGSSDFVVERCTFVASGAATGCIQSSRYEILDNLVSVESNVLGIPLHDGVIDNWDGSNSAKIRGNRIIGNGIGSWGILMTGEATDGTSNSCYDFDVSNNSILSFNYAGIRSNGRGGVNEDVQIARNLVKHVDFGSLQGSGIVIEDTVRAVVSGNQVVDCGRHGILLDNESGEGTTAVLDSVVSGNVVQDVNRNGQVAATTGAAILLGDVTSGCVVEGNRCVVSSQSPGSSYSYGIACEGTVGENLIGRNYIDRGLSGTISRGNSTTRLPSWEVISQSAAAVSHTGDTSETTLATITIPAGRMGKNGSLRVTTQFTVTNNANAKTGTIRLGGTGGTGYSTQAMASTLTQRAQVEIWNRNSESSQVGTVNGAGTGEWGNSTGGFQTGAIDTSQAQQLLIRGTLGNAADTITLEAYRVELLQRD